MTKKGILRLLLTLASLFFTGWGVYLLFKGDITNGLLALILGELIDVPKVNRIKN